MSNASTAAPAVTASGLAPPDTNTAADTVGENMSGPRLSQDSRGNFLTSTKLQTQNEK